MNSPTTTAPAGTDAPDLRADARGTGDAGGNRRSLTGPSRLVVVAVATAYAAFYIWTAVAGLVSPQAHRGIYIGGAAVLTFLVYPARRGRPGDRVPWYDVALALLAGSASAYFVLAYPAMVDRAGLPTTADVVFGSLIVVLSLEVTRRTAGMVLAAVGAVFIAYAFVGPWLTAVPLLAHRGHGLSRVIATEFMSFNGVFGLVADIFATYVLLFIFFGSVLERSGAGQFFIDLPYAIAGRFRGGPAKAAILVSALMGSISGSAVANVMTTGTFTIPLMRKSGYRAEFAAGVETAASTGGQMLPPVMGAGAFIIAEFTRTPYSRIVLLSIIPALLYFVSVYFMVDFRALRRQLRGVASDELERPRDVLRRGWFNLVPVVVLFGMVLLDYSPAFAAFFGIVTAVLIGFVPYRGERMSLRDVFDALWQGSVNSLAVAGVAGTIGVVLGILGLTGLGLKFTDLVVSASGGNLLVALVLVTLASWVLGAGLTATSSYVVVAILAAPALELLIADVNPTLVSAGTTLVAAHLIIFWVSQDANLTPPVCIAAFAAASISGADPMKTGFESWKLGRGLYIVPILMAFSPLMGGTWQQLVPLVLTGLLGLYAFAAGTSRWLVTEASLVESVLLLVAGSLLLWPGLPTNVAGAVLLGLLYVVGVRRRRTSPPMAELAIG